MTEDAQWRKLRELLAAKHRAALALGMAGAACASAGGGAIPGTAV
jgi:hypothetical protein